MKQSDRPGRSGESRLPGEKGEIALVRRLAAELCVAPTHDAPQGVPFGDDMAELCAGGEYLWTTDMLMDGVDFDSRVHAWRAIGRKAMAVNLSDCAAMAAKPVSALCAVALNNQMSMEDALELMRGVRDCGREYGCEVRGGDTNSWDQSTVIAVTVAARVPEGQSPVRRDGARPGDGAYLTGPVGGSILGRHMTFTPRVEVAGRVARELRTHAMIDVSDGVAIDLWRMCEASGCGVRLDEDLLGVAIHPDAHILSRQSGKPALDHALHDGEDFELIVALAADVDASRVRGAGLLRIGEFLIGGGLSIRGADGSHRTLEPRGWEHFR